MHTQSRVEFLSSSGNQTVHLLYKYMAIHPFLSRIGQCGTVTCARSLPSADLGQPYDPDGLADTERLLLLVRLLGLLPMLQLLPMPLLLPFLQL
jgi:hypothetical protein